MNAPHPPLRGTFSPQAGRRALAMLTARAPSPRVSVERVGARREALGRVGGLDQNKNRPYHSPRQARSLRQNMNSNSLPLTFPLLRNGPLPLPAARGEEFPQGGRE